MKKILLTTLLLASVSAFTDPMSSSAPVKKLNNPAVGGRQSGSEQIFGHPKSSGQKGQVYNSGNKTQSNNPVVGGRQSGSEQIFGHPKSSGQKGQVYNSGNKTQSNNPVVGGRQSSSDQIFGNPGNAKSN